MGLDPYVGRTDGPMTALVADTDPLVRLTIVDMLERQGIRVTEAPTWPERDSAHIYRAFDLVIANRKLVDNAGSFSGTHSLEPDAATILLVDDAPEDGDGLVDDGADYLITPFTTEQLALTVIRALRRRAEQVGAKQSAPQDDVRFDGMIGSLIRAGHYHDEETSEHVERVSRSAALIARELGLSSEKCATLRAASALHDIGKIGVPDAILHKPGSLTEEERALIEVHTRIGQDILAGTGIAVFDMASSIAATHHERVDGAGYPNGLNDGEIPLVGRITAVADAFDALTHDRVYRPAFTTAEALTVLKDGSGTRFDSRVLAAFHAVRHEIKQIRSFYPDPLPASKRAEAGGNAEPPLRIFLVQEHAALASALAGLLRQEGMEIAGVANTLAEARRMIEQRVADVIILDVKLHDESGLDLLGIAHAHDVRVLLYAGAVTPTTAPGAEAPDGTASKVGTKVELLTAIRQVAGGHSPLDPRVEAAPPNGDTHLLTPREREIVSLLARGLNGEEIAESLFLSPHTVRTHIRNATGRMQAKTRAHLVTLAAEAGEITVESGAVSET